MAIVVCGECGQRLQVREATAEAKLRCPKCDVSIVVPGANDGGVDVRRRGGDSPWPKMLVGGGVFAGVLGLGLAVTAFFLRGSDGDALAGQVNPNANEGGVDKAPVGQTANAWKPAALAADATEVKLPSRATSVCVAGGGRYLILNLAADRHLAVFDCEAAKIVKYLPIGGHDVLMAANLKSLVVCAGPQGPLRRYSLATYKLEGESTLPEGQTVLSLAMGSASSGPLAAAVRVDRAINARLALWDPETFVPSPMTPGTGAPHASSTPRLAMSADGRVVVDGGQVWVREGETYRGVRAAYGGAPGPDGESLFSQGRVSPVRGEPQRESTSGHGRAIWYVPATHDDGLFFSFNERSANGMRQYLEINFHKRGSLAPIATLKQANGSDGLVDWISGQTQRFEQHAFYVPGAQLLAILPTTRDRLCLHRIDLDALAKNVAK